MKVHFVKIDFSHCQIKTHSNRINIKGSHLVKTNINIYACLRLSTCHINHRSNYMFQMKSTGFPIESIRPNNKVHGRSFVAKDLIKCNHKILLALKDKIFKTQILMLIRFKLNKISILFFFKSDL